MKIPESLLCIHVFFPHKVYVFEPETALKKLSLKKSTGFSFLVPREVQKIDY